MTERYDHATAAINLRQLASGSTEEGQVSVLLAAAQVHATLALAEQQRIANLIAWTTANGAEPLDHVEQEIEEGLGL